MNQDQLDYFFMSEALILAEKGNNACHPNPRVGAVIVKDNQVISRGFHQKYGSKHAEVEAILSCKDQKKLINSTIYVTLEPCSHQGKTPPCVDLIIERKISRVVVATLDPNPQVNGEGIKRLKMAGIDITIGILENQAKELNLGFFSRILNNRPFIRSKIASSFDGKTSLSNKVSKWITNKYSRENVQQIRAQSSAILTSYKTVNDDNPKLTVRSLPDDAQPIRFIMDTHLKIDLDSDILKQKNVYVLHGVDLKEKPDVAAMFVKIKMNASGLILSECMRLFQTMEINELLIEAGPGLNGVFLKNHLIDELIAFQSPSVMGGQSNEMFNQPVLEDMKSKINLKLQDQRFFNNDLRSIFRVSYVD